MSDFGSKTPGRPGTMAGDIKTPMMVGNINKQRTPSVMRIPGSINAKGDKAGIYGVGDKGKHKPY